MFGERQDCSFHSDNAPIHNPNFTKQWLSDHSIETRSSPPKSLDLEIIENVLDIKARTLVRAEKYYNNVEDLEEPIPEAWGTVESGFFSSCTGASHVACMQ